MVRLTTIIPVQRRRYHQAEEEAKFHDAYFACKIRVKHDETTKEINVCFKAFQSIHGVSKSIPNPIIPK